MNTHNLIYILICFLLSGFFNNVMDTIIHHARNGNPNWIDRILARGEYCPGFYQWLVYNGYYFNWTGFLHWLAVYWSALRDGWHAAKWLSYLFAFLPIWILMGFIPFILSGIVWTFGFYPLYKSKDWLNEK